jgi:hypothetical protein
MMCPACHYQPHIFLDCQFPLSCTCQHRTAVSGNALTGSNSESSTDSTVIDQEPQTHATDRLDA